MHVFCARNASCAPFSGQSLFHLHGPTKLDRNSKSTHQSEYIYVSCQIRVFMNIYGLHDGVFCMGAVNNRTVMKWH